jgi:hypothetical protein
LLREKKKERVRETSKKGRGLPKLGLLAGFWNIFLAILPGNPISTRLQCPGKVYATG